MEIFKKRVILVLVIFIILFVIIIARVYTLQIINYENYKKQSLGNSLTLSSITPVRGRIFDRNGVLLADNNLLYQLIIVPERVNNLEQALQKLKQDKFITDEDIKSFNKKYKRFKQFQNITLKKKLANEKVARFLVNNRINGIELVPYFHRVYPNGKTNSHIIGYIAKMDEQDKKEYFGKNYKGNEYVGKIGIEKQYEKLLHGKSGVKQIERDVEGRVLDEKIVKQSISGKDLYLSIDNSLQLEAAKQLKHMRGSVVMLDVNNGEVLVMISSPSFDNNSFVQGISHQDYNELKNNKDLPLFNRSIAGIYPPGSTIKPIVALSGLEAKVIDKRSTVFCPGYYELPNYSRKFNDWNRNGHGTVGVTDSIAQSCDIFYYDLARKMGIDSLYYGLNNFGLGQKTGIDLPGEKSGILPSKNWKRIYKKEPWYEGETLISGIGQGFMAVTPLQLAYATSLLANYGQKIVPTLIKDDNTSNAKQIPIKNISNWNLVIDGMKKAVYSPKGTARRLNKGLKYTLAGKTGTAQIFGLDPEEKYIAERYAEHLRDHSLFVGFAPIDKPEVAISVVVENAGNGSAVAAPIAKKILDKYFSNK